jgi:hypothetical protein
MQHAIQLTWSEFKAAFDASNGTFMAYIDTGSAYIAWFTMFGMLIRCDDLFKDGRTDTTDFVNNYKDAANPPEADRTRIVNCRIGYKLHDRYVTFTTADNQNFDNTDHNGDSFGDFTYSMLDSNGDPTTTNANAVQTVLDFYPDYDYEVSGGNLFVPASLTAPTSAWELHVIGAPDIPAAYGGSIAFVANPRLDFRLGDYFRLDSALNPAQVSGVAAALARKIRWIVSHPQAAQQTFQLNMQIFK